MRRIAHLSDVHILDCYTAAARQPRRYRFATKLVSDGRRIDPLDRATRLASALARAKASGADHFVISGDLTEVGAASEFEQFAEIVHNARLPSGSVTLVPGNHETYTKRGAWAEALAGPLKAFADASALPSSGGGGRSLGRSPDSALRVVEREGVVLFPIDSTRFQSIAWSGGIFTRNTGEALSRRIEEHERHDRSLVLVLHHPPFYPKAAPWQRWIDSLHGCDEVLALLARHPRLQLLHGHLHQVVDRVLDTDEGEGGASAGEISGVSRRPSTRIFGAPAVCDGRNDASRIRFYDLADGELRAATAENPPRVPDERKPGRAA